jgi:hypothetical protein
LPTQTDGDARSEFERAARSGTLRAPPTAAPLKPAEAKARFSRNTGALDGPPVQRYIPSQKNRWFEFPIQLCPISRQALSKRRDQPVFACPLSVMVNHWHTIPSGRKTVSIVIVRFLRRACTTAQDDPCLYHRDAISWTNFFDRARKARCP